MRGRNGIHGVFVGENPTTPALIKIHLADARPPVLELEQATTLDEALNRLSKSKPDLVLLNDRLPPSKSFRAPLAQILATTPACPVVLLCDQTPSDFGLYGIDRRIRSVWREIEFSPVYLAACLNDIFPPQDAAA